MTTLTTRDHRRNIAGMKYVYPVFSRRANGLSIGININTNNACNWRCIYCQVPELIRAKPEKVDLFLLRHELTSFLDSVQSGDFFRNHTLPDHQKLVKDIAISGNGEPTLTPEFSDVMELITDVMDHHELNGKISRVLITNGSGILKDNVQSGIKHLASQGGEIWFKLDSATEKGIRRINQIRMTPKTLLTRLSIAAHLCPTWIQTCLFNMNGNMADNEGSADYLALLQTLNVTGIPLQGVMLYGLARASMQPEADQLSPASREYFEHFASQIRHIGLKVSISI